MDQQVQKWTSEMSTYENSMKTRSCNKPCDIHGKKKKEKKLTRFTWQSTVCQKNNKVPSHNHKDPITLSGYEDWTLNSNIDPIKNPGMLMEQNAAANTLGDGRNSIGTTHPATGYDGRCSRGTTPNQLTRVITWWKKKRKI